jgi:DNA-binding XRE family transcriptional regulator
VKKKTPPTKETAGSRALSVVCMKLGPTAIAKRIGVTAKAIHYLATGKRHPSSPTQKRIAKHFEIPIDAWSSEAGPAPAFVPPVLEQARSTLLEAEANLAVAKAARDRALGDKHATTRDLTTSAVAVDRAIARLTEARGEDDISEARIANSPAWAKLCRKIVEALRPIKGAREALQTVCQDLMEIE